MGMTLGTVAFSVDEAPESVELGGEQAVAVRKYPGGQLDIQTLGAFDDPISWTGTLYFQTALARMAALNAMRIAAVPVTLQIGSLFVTVVVTKFKPTYRNDFYIPYHIEVQPTAVMSMEPGGQAGTPATTLSGGAAGEVPPTAGGAFAFQSSMTPAALADSSSVPPTFLTSSQFSSAQAAPVGAIINQMSPATQAAISPVLPTSTQSTYLVASGDTLWSIAAQFYGNGSRWTDIATANNIQDPVTIAAGQQITIPNPTQGA